MYYQAYISLHKPHPMTIMYSYRANFLFGNICPSQQFGHNLVGVVHSEWGVCAGLMGSVKIPNPPNVKKFL